MMQPSNKHLYTILDHLRVLHTIYAPNSFDQRYVLKLHNELPALLLLCIPTEESKYN